jgi:hypothetical protein
VWIDVVAFEAAAAAARRSGEPAAFEAALALYSGLGRTAAIAEAERLT